MDKQHDGKLSTLIATCDLKHPLAMQHPERCFPAYCFIGRNKIHYILVMPQLQVAVLRSGSLPLYSLSRLTIDPTMLTLMLYWPLLIMRRGFQLPDPRLVDKYKEYFHHQCNYHHIREKVEHFRAVSLDYGQMLLLMNISMHITGAMISAERKAGQKISQSLIGPLHLSRLFRSEHLEDKIETL